jgi:hypothetical protein
MANDPRLTDGGRGVEAVTPADVRAETDSRPASLARRLGLADLLADRQRAYPLAAGREDRIE